MSEPRVSDADRATRWAYADPPYVGQSKKKYGNEATYAGEVDHEALIERLLSEFPDGWALSCSAPSVYGLMHILEQRGMSLLRGDYRQGVWVKPFAIFKPNVNPAFAYEPVLFRPIRKRGRELATVRDWVSCNITLKRGLCGVKPEGFCSWLFDIMGAQAGDEMVDLFPGSGAVGAAWEQWQRRIA